MLSYKLPENFLSSLSWILLLRHYARKVPSRDLRDLRTPLFRSRQAADFEHFPNAFSQAEVR